MKIKLDVIEKDDDIYPRQEISLETIRNYVEALKAGAKFPPIEAQRIRVRIGEDTSVKTISLDGWHRIETYKEYNQIKGVEPITDVEVVFWKQKILEKEESLEELRFESALRNAMYGDRLSKEDLKFQIQRIAQSNPNITEQQITERFKGIVSQQTVNNWIKGIRETQEESRTSFILRQRLLGFGFEEISEQLKSLPMKSIKRTMVGRVYDDIFTKFSKSIAEDYDSGKTIPEIAEYNKIKWIDPYSEKLDITLVWAMIIQDKTDLERFEIFGESKYGNEEPKTFNVWNFPDMDERLGLPCGGHNPGQIAMNLLFYYTKEEDLVIDPMVGGGSTIDACLIMGRKCRAYDIRNEWMFKGTRYSRGDIIVRDFWEKGYEEKVSGCDFIFLDPPHYEIVFDDYYKSIEDFHEKMKILASRSLETVKEGGYVSLLMLDKTKQDYRCLTGDCYKIFLEVGFKCAMKISAPLTTFSASQSEQSQAKLTRKMLGRNRNIYVFKK